MSGLLDQLFRQRRRPRPPQPGTVISRYIGKAIAGLVLAGVAAVFGLKDKTSHQDNLKNNQSTISSQQHVKTQVDLKDENYQLVQAIEANLELDFVQVKNAQVIKLLRADNRGARHQRWIIQLPSGHTITAVYNIDLSEKIPLEVGSTMDLAGQLVFGDKKHDPILHWIHADPQKRRRDGYVIYNGKSYGKLDQMNN